MEVYFGTQSLERRDDSSPFETVSVETETQDSQNQTSLTSLHMDVSSTDIDGSAKGAQPCSPYVLRVQSNRFPDNQSIYESEELKNLLKRDLLNRVTLTRGIKLAEFLFPDSVFGFPINIQFAKNFYNSFLSNEGDLDPNNFSDEESTAVFLNRTVSTIAHFLDATKQVSFKPLRYFSAAQAKRPLAGHVLKRKPDIILIPLIDGYLRNGDLGWHNVQAIVEHTREKSVPQRLPDTVSTKSYIAFSSQAERDFLVSLCLTIKGFYIVASDHAGQVETELLTFTEPFTLVFIRIVMGLAFLPDSLLGVDTTIVRDEARTRSSTTFSSHYKPFSYNITEPLLLFASSEPRDGPSTATSTSTPTEFPTSTQDFTGGVGTTSTSTPPGGITTISVGPNVYKVVGLLFKSQTLIGRASTVFLVQLPGNSGGLGVLKDSWITTDRLEEAKFLEGVSIPFGPKLIDHCILRNTHRHREHSITPSSKHEHREKRRVVTYPAGVHIANFSSLWELMAAFLDIVIGKEI
jgi:Fungal protein kinase